MDLASGGYAASHEPEVKPTPQINITHQDSVRWLETLSSEEFADLVGRLLRRERQPGTRPG